jgi:FkbM family methyltransferase
MIKTLLRKIYLPLLERWHFWRLVRQSNRMRSILGPHAQAVLAATPEGRFLVSPDDRGVGAELLEAGQYQLEELAFLRDLLRPDWRLLVVGAHVGSLAIPLGRHAASLTAIEANPSTFELLQANLILNACSKAEAILLAANDRPGHLAFLDNRVNSGGSKRAPVHTRLRYEYDSPGHILVEAGCLDDRLEGCTYEMILMDIEGSEVFALRGMPRLLAACQVLVVEFIPHHLQDVAGITPADFLAPIMPHFDRLFVPSLKRSVDREGFLALLEEMCARGEGDNGIIFSRNLQK